MGMAFDISQLTRWTTGGPDNNALWHYRQDADTLATILASGYFGQDSTTGQQASDMLVVADTIIAIGSDGHAVLRVDTISGNTVTTEIGVGESQWLTVPVAVLSTSGGVYLAAPFDGVVRRYKVVTNGEIDTTTVLSILNAGTVMTGGAVALDQSGQGAGEVYSGALTGGNTVSENDAVQITWDGATSAELQANEADVVVQLEFVPA